MAKKTTKQVKAKFFQSIELNKDKYEALVSCAMLNRTVKNFLSSYIYNSEIRRRILMNEFSENDLKTETKDCRKKFANKDKNGNDFYISATCFQRSCTDVFTAYSNQLDTITKKKLNNCNKIKGYLAFFIKHYKNENELMSYVTSKKNSTDKDANFYKSFYNFLELLKSKNMYDRFVNLSLKMRERLINSLKLIEFKSLTFQDMNVLTESPSKNKSGKSLTLNNSLKKGNCIFNLNLAGFCQIPIIVKYSNKYHGNLSKYNGSLQKNGNISFNRSITYSVKFLENRKIRVIFFPKEDIANYKFDKKKTNALGVDINTSNNLFSLSDGKQISYENKLFKQAVTLEKHVSRKQSNKSNDGSGTKKYSKKTQKRINKMNRRSEFYANKKASELIKYIKENGYDTLVCEDLNIKNSKTKYKKNEINYNKVASYFHLNDYKNVFERLCKKNNINFVKVNPAFTSQGCPVCGHIDKSNRNHRTFLCKRCGHKANADINAAVNIKNRFTNQYLREKLLRFDNEKQIYVGTKHDFKCFYVNTYQMALLTQAIVQMMQSLKSLKALQTSKVLKKVSKKKKKKKANK